MIVPCQLKAKRDFYYWSARGVMAIDAGEEATVVAIDADTSMVRLSLKNGRVAVLKKRTVERYFEVVKNESENGT